MTVRYTVTGALGEGARRFRAVADDGAGIRRDVVITRLPLQGTTNEAFVTLFLTDLRPLIALQHANVVELLDITTTHDDTYFLVAEHVPGCDLRTLLARRTRSPVPEALRIAIACCEGLAYAHTRPILHRYVSPHTILLSTSGDVKLVDFGLAGAGLHLERHDLFGYLAPEAAEGREVDHRGDVFAAGVVLWELLSGRRLFHGDTDYQTVELVREARVPAIEELDPALEAILRTALARDAAARFQVASDLGDALAGYAASRNLSLAADELARAVRDVNGERSAASTHLTHVQAEVERMTSILGDRS